MWWRKQDAMLLWKWRKGTWAKQCRKHSSRGWTKQGYRSPPAASRGNHPLIGAHWTWFETSEPPQLSKNKFIVQDAKYVVICYRGNGKWIQKPRGPRQRDQGSSCPSCGVLFHSFMAGPAHLVIWFRKIPVFHYSKSTFRLGQPES